jgi:hypothetical protein
MTAVDEDMTCKQEIIDLIPNLSWEMQEREGLRLSQSRMTTG